jgi:hypothetical protein
MFFPWKRTIDEVEGVVKQALQGFDAIRILNLSHHSTSPVLMHIDL